MSKIAPGGGTRPHPSRPTGQLLGLLPAYAVGRSSPTVNEQSLYRFLALALLAPLWVPVLKALYTDFQGALWEEGGLFGRPPGKRDLEKLRERFGDYESPLVNEPHETRRFKDRSTAPRTTGASRTPAPAPPSSGAARRRSF